MDGDTGAGPHGRPEHRTDALATKFVEKTGEMQEKAMRNAPGTDGMNKGPAGGFDSTPVPKVPPGYTMKFTFHRATNLPMADISTFSSDPYVLAQLKTSLPKRHKQDPYMRFRTPTIRRNVEPEWNSEWVVANVPASGFQLKARIYDEDPADHDDRLGNVHVNVAGISEDWGGIREESYTLKKRMGSKRAYFIRGCAAMFDRKVHMSGHLVVSVQVLSRSQVENGGRIYTVGPCNWTKHLSPLIGRLAGTKDPEGSGGKKAEKYEWVYLCCSTPDPILMVFIAFKLIKYSLPDLCLKLYITVMSNSNPLSQGCLPHIPFEDGY